MQLGLQITLVVTSVPWQLRSSERRDLSRVEYRAGDVRSGIDRATPSETRAASGG